MYLYLYQNHDYHDSHISPNILRIPCSLISFNVKKWELPRRQRPVPPRHDSLACGTSSAPTSSVHGRVHRNVIYIRVQGTAFICAMSTRDGDNDPSSPQKEAVKKRAPVVRPEEFSGWQTQPGEITAASACISSISFRLVYSHVASRLVRSSAARTVVC